MNAQTQIEELAQSKLLGRIIDPVGFVDELLALASREGEVHCTPAGNEALRFGFPGQQLVFEVPVDRARGKLRMMCARLGVLCNETEGQDVCLYGGEGIIKRETPAPLFVPPQETSTNGGEVPAASQRQGGMGPVYKARQVKLDRLVALKVSPRGNQWKVRFKNTMHEHEFTIQKM